MAIDLHNEHLLTLSEAAEQLPRLRRGRKIHISTLYRWISTGVKGIQLEAGKLGRTLVTSTEALQRFFDRLSEADGTVQLGPSRLSRQAKQAERELDRRGL